MTPLRDDRLVDRYLEQLDAAAAVTGLGRARRLDLIDDISSHINGEVGVARHADPARVREVLDRLGSPEAIAGAAAERPPPPPGIHQGPATPESLALVLLALSPIAGLFEIGLRQGGWLLITGVAATLVVRSAKWSRREKILGLLAIPLTMVALIALLEWRLSEPVRPFEGFKLGAASALGAAYLHHRVNARIRAVVTHQPRS